MGRAAGPGDDHLDAAGGCGAAEVDHVERRAVGGDDTNLDLDAELGEHVGRRLHRLEVRVAAHHDGDAHVVLPFRVSEVAVSLVSFMRAAATAVASRCAVARSGPHAVT